MDHAEHNLQVKVNQFVREVVPEPHQFFSVDRSAKRGRWQHVREKARGLVAGTSDTILLYPGLPAIVVELKRPGEKPDDNQERFGAQVTASGHLWGWCATVFGYGAILLNAGVPLMEAWALIAARHDATLASASIRKEESRTGKVSKRRYQAAEKPSPAKLRRTEALRARIPF